MADKKTIVATGYKQVGSRATPEAIGKNLRLLPPSAGPLDARKRALHDLSIALACEPLIARRMHNHLDPCFLPFSCCGLPPPPSAASRYSSF